MPERTLFLSKLLGLYILLAVAALASHRQLTLQAIAGFLESPSQMLLLGILTTLGGLAMVLAHNTWRGGSLTLMITVISWLAFFKGLLLLFLPPAAEFTLFRALLHHTPFLYLWMFLIFLLGAWLTWGGFTATRPGEQLS